MRMPTLQTANMLYLQTIPLQKWLDHKDLEGHWGISPSIIIMPFYEGTREQEILENMIKDFNKDAIYTIHIINDLDEIV